MSPQYPRLYHSAAHVRAGGTESLWSTAEGGVVGVTYSCPDLATGAAYQREHPDAVFVGHGLTMEASGGMRLGYPAAPTTAPAGGYHTAWGTIDEELIRELSPERFEVPRQA